MRTLAIIAVVLFPTFGFAQTSSFELFGTTGIVTLWDDESKLGTGVSVGGGVGVRLPSRIGIEALVEAHENDRRFGPPSDVRFDSEVLGARVRIAKYFSSGGAQPYAGGALGFARVKSVYDYPAGCMPGPGFLPVCPTRDVHRRTTNTPTFGGFAGVRISAGRNVFVRPEFEVSFGREHMKLAGNVAVGYGW